MSGGLDFPRLWFELRVPCLRFSAQSLREWIHALPVSIPRLGGARNMGVDNVELETIDPDRALAVQETAERNVRHVRRERCPSRAARQRRIEQGRVLQRFRLPVQPSC